MPSAVDMIGLVPLAQTTVRAYAVAFSVDYDNYYLPRLDRFFHSLEAL